MNEIQTDDQIDQMLRRHFQSEMPNPWPAFVAPRSALPRPVRLGRPWLSRLAMAACVALLFLGYWSFSQWFPNPTPTEDGIVQKDTIGSKPKVTDKLSTPAKNGDSDEGMGRMERVPLP